MKNYLYTLGLLFTILIPKTGFSQQLTISPGSKFKTPSSNTTFDSLLSSLRRDTITAPFQYFLPLSGREMNKKPIESNPEMRYNMPIKKPEKTSKILIAHFDLDFPYRYNMPILKFSE